jgi:hypothetical protein
MVYFMWFLAHDSKPIPWTFIWVREISHRYVLRTCR